MKKKILTRQKGFTLVVVLLITMMASTLVLTSIKDSTVQERLSGNFQKKINSRMMAERGVFDTVNQMNEHLENDSSLTLESLVTAIQDGGMTGAAAINEIAMAYGVNIEVLSGNRVSITSTGELLEGQARLQAIYELVIGSSSTTSGIPYVSGVTACEAISVTGSGTINSYNSALGVYNASTNSGEDVTVQTLSDGSVEFVGGTDIDGSVIAADEIRFLGSANISGNVESVGAIDVTQGGGVVIGGNISTLSSFQQSSGSVGGTIHANGQIILNQTPVGGNVISNSTVTITGNTIDGYVLALSDVTLSGTTIQGDVQTHQNYTQSNGTVNGDVLAEGNVELSGASIAGGVETHQNYTQSNGTVNGGVLAEGDITLTNATINGGVNSHGNYVQTGATVSGGVTVIGDLSLAQYNATINGSVSYGGNGQWIVNNNPFYAFPYASTSPAPTLADVRDADDVPVFESSIVSNSTDSSELTVTTCDAEDIASKVSEVSDGITEAKNLIISSTGGSDPDGDRPSGHGNGDVYIMGSSIADFAINYDSESVLKSLSDSSAVTDTGTTQISTQSAVFFDQTRDVFMYESADINGHLKVAPGQDVTMYVKGDFVMGGNGSLTIPDGSSLTLIIEGKVSISEGAQVYTPDNGVTASGLPVISIYSSYSGTDIGITMGGGTNAVYAVIYAPITNVEITSNTGFSGSAYGNNVTVSGSGDVHYDTALGDINASGGTTVASSGYLAFRGWQYIADEIEDSSE